MKYIFTAHLLFLICHTITAQVWDGSAATTTTGGYNTSFQLTYLGWGSHHGILFNARLASPIVDGFLFTPGNTKHAFDVGPYSSGAGAIMYMGNGGRMDFFISDNSTGAGQDVTWGDPKLTLTRTGVGIGTVDPKGYKLAVNGKIWTQEVNVAINIPGPDYVFEKDYDLLPLSELETYITKHKHLPEVPSAKQMEADGLNLKEMNLLLLKKVEELTLHLIEKDKQMIKLEDRLKRLEEKK